MKPASAAIRGLDSRRAAIPVVSVSVLSCSGVMTRSSVTAAGRPSSAFFTVLESFLPAPGTSCLARNQRGRARSGRMPPSRIGGTSQTLPQIRGTHLMPPWLNDRCKFPPPLEPASLACVATTSS